MGGAGANLKISFGSAKKGDAADKERIVGSVTFNSNRALDQSPILNTLADNLTSIAINPKFLKGTTSNFGGYTTQQTLSCLSRAFIYAVLLCCAKRSDCLLWK